MPKNKKIGILTFQSGNNYGGILQCYALQNIVKSLGYEVEVINYIQPGVPAFKKIAPLIKSSASVSDFIYKMRDLFSVFFSRGYSESELQTERKKAILKEFDHFRNTYLNLSPVVTPETIGTYARRYDVIIVGSDQVWTPLYGNTVYFLDWFPEFQGKRISYAACSAHSSVRKFRRRKLKSSLDKFQAISVRDHTTARLVENITGSVPEIVQDPTQLYDFREFVNRIEKPYILTYILGSEIDGGHELSIRKIKDKTGDMEVIAIVIPGCFSDIKSVADQVIYEASPEEWVNLIANASFVYTDSFHGVLFSLKFKKPFLAYYKDVIRASRLLDLKERYRLNNIVQNITEYSFEDTQYLDPECCNKESSMNFLKSNLDEK
ncbi:polysaccharide pyruvyl transferase family protein [Coprobacter tertius]|uniref:Polysaccharide pyruvyl transferase family protein n=1 Tax=Coprobacter tertius TaxID=2944915 RepID=A0ABT1MLC5_9BACT|nr:polysaccharide pyruvyl transferase family protein [Coprobacter tertius]MCP9612686.1 polysaccharide pyruvyl transferase family protein [Coprobacter tertius]